MITTNFSYLSIKDINAYVSEQDVVNELFSQKMSLINAISSCKKEVLDQ